MTVPIRLALVGAGAMSRHHARVIADSARARLDVVIDPQVDHAEALASTIGCSFARGLDAAKKCDAVVVASSTSSHVDVALELLAARRPLLIEKPLAADVDGVKRIIKESESAGVPIMCGFVERFNPVIATALSRIESAPVHVVALRHSPRTLRTTTSVVHDLLIHDIDLAVRLMAGAEARHVTGTLSTPYGSLVDVSDCTIHFSTGAVATLSASRASQRKVRDIFISSKDSMMELDLLRANLTVYRHVHHEQIANGSTTYRAETAVDIPFVRHAGEPLALQLEHFIRLVEGAGDADAERATLLAPHEIAARVEDGW
jgi:predicted dehydrogenase